MGRSLEEKINEIATKLDLYDYFEGFICPETLTGSPEQAEKTVAGCRDIAAGICEIDHWSDLGV